MLLLEALFWASLCVLEGSMAFAESFFGLLSEDL